MRCIYHNFFFTIYLILYFLRFHKFFRFLVFHNCRPLGREFFIKSFFFRSLIFTSGCVWNVMSPLVNSKNKNLFNKIINHSKSIVLEVVDSYVVNLVFVVVGHSVEICKFFYHSNFMWNQCANKSKHQIKSFRTFSKLRILILAVFVQLISRKIWVLEKILNFHTVLE